MQASKSLWTLTLKDVPFELPHLHCTVYENTLNWD